MMSAFFSPFITKFVRFCGPRTLTNISEREQTVGSNPIPGKQEPRTIIDTWKENWSTFFVIGYLLSAFVANTQMGLLLEQIEIHYRLFLMMILATVSFGGFMLTVFPWPASVLICCLVVVFHRRPKHFGGIVK